MKKRVLIGTTNPAKVQRFTALLAGAEAEIVTPLDLHISGEPEELGRTPEENARVKAEFYGKFCERVICNDSGLYLEGLSREAPRQPGLHVRTPRGTRLDDEEMIAYYSALAHSLGGRTLAYYLDGVAAGVNGAVCCYMDEEEARETAFYLVDKPHTRRHPGWPLDSISVSRATGLYFVEETAARNDPVIRNAYFNRLRAFLLRALQLESGI